MLFDQITLTGFKNYESQTFVFDRRIVGICGLNGKGKTNLLDALNYLCFTRSYFGRSDQTNVLIGAEGFRLSGGITNGSARRKTVTCIYRGNSKKDFLLDDVPYQKFSHHIGKFPCVFIAPDDIALITGGGEERRKFVDTLISQIDENYLQNLINYNRLLSQRNALLKYEHQKNRRDDMLLETIDEKMVTAGTAIHRLRRQFSGKLFPLIEKFYDAISGSAEPIGLEYESQLNEVPFAELLKSTIEKDRFTMRSNAGVHKDDLAFKLLDNPFRQIASQGQKKSLLFACKLAEMKILEEEKGFPPLLLLDDIFEKLDDLRVANLLNFIIGKNEGQVFITDTNAERLRSSVSGFEDELQIIQLD